MAVIKLDKEDVDTIKTQHEKFLKLQKTQKQC